MKTILYNKLILVAVFLACCFANTNLFSQEFINEFHDLNDNQVPNNWVFYVDWGDVSISEGKLISKPVDAYGYLGRTGTVPNEANSIECEWDGNNNYTYWGMCSQLEIKFNENENLKIYHQSAEYNFGSEEARVFLVYRNESGYDEVIERIIPLQFDDYHYSVNLSSGSVNFSGQIISKKENFFTESFDLTSIVPGFDLQNINALNYWTNTTTDNNNWLDNISIQLNTGNVESDGWTHINNDLAGSSFYPDGSNIHSNQIAESWSFSSFDYNFRNVLAGNVSGDSKLEIVTVQDQVLYMLDSEGNTILSKDISISNQKNARVTMLEDINNDQLLDIGVGYALFPNYGQGKARIYDGNGSLLNEFTKAVNSDMMLEPLTIVGNDLIIAEDAGYAKDPRGFSRWSLSSESEIWQFDVGPGYRAYSIADMNNDGLLELSWGNGTVHNGASGNGTTDGDNYTIIVDENGNEELIQKYNEGDSNGNLYDVFIKFDDTAPYKIVSFKIHGETYYHGTSRIHIRTTNGTVEHTFSGLQNATWLYGWADIDNDNIQEIVATNKNNNSNILYIFDEQLNVQQSLNMPANDYYFRAIADVNGDGTKEIIVSSSSDHKIIAYNLNLNEVWSWTDSSLGTIQKVIVSDNNLNGKLDVCVLAENKIVMLTGDGVTAIPENSEVVSTIYPNPVSNTLNILNANHNNSIRIYGINGKKVIEGNVTENMDVSTLPCGMYFIRIYDDNKIIDTHKFIKR